jgi:hypothetical protein
MPQGAQIAESVRIAFGQAATVAQPGLTVLCSVAPKLALSQQYGAIAR